MNSAIYDGWVRHRRREAMAHAFRYRLFVMYLDLDGPNRVFAGRLLWSSRYLAPAWFRRRDYLPPAHLPLKAAVQELVARQTGRPCASPVRVLTPLRYWGYCFNPITFYYCFEPDGERVSAVVAEVRNTPWGERHPYVLVNDLANGSASRRHYPFPKRLHVSPFMEMDMTYEQHLTVPGETLRGTSRTGTRRERPSMPGWRCGACP